MANDAKNMELANSFLQAAEGELNLAYEPRVVFPGDDVSSIIQKSGGGSAESSSKAAKIGPGLHVRTATSTTGASVGKGGGVAGMSIAVDAVGILRHRAPCHYWVETSKTKYAPQLGDQVVGIVEDRGGDFYSVNIFSGSHCIMSRLAFEGATKRNKPELKRGDVVYARVVHAVNSGSDVELSCTSSAGGSKKEWTTGETVRFIDGDFLTFILRIAFPKDLSFDFRLLSFFCGRLVSRFTASYRRVW